MIFVHTTLIYQHRYSVVQVLRCVDVALTRACVDAQAAGHQIRQVVGQM